MAGAVETERSDAVATIRMNRPDRLNALDADAMRQLRASLQAVAMDPSVRAVLLTGAGRAFCAGGDVQSMGESLRAHDLPRFFHELTGEQELAVREIMGMRKPVVAALPGVAAGGGLALALAADWRIASPRAMLYPAFPALGAVPDGGLTYLLPHFLGIGGAQEVLLNNTRLDADRAHSMGLLHEVVPEAELEPRSRERAKVLAAGPTFAYGWMKHLMLSAFHQPLEAQLALERRGAVDAAIHGELEEGIRAFLERRPPKFEGPAAAPFESD